MTRQEKYPDTQFFHYHNARVNAADLAAELGCTKAYVSMVFNGARSPANAQERFEEAFQAVIAKRSDPGIPTA